MARPSFAVEGDGLQIWRVAANILNKQSRTAERGLSSSLGLGWGTNTPDCKTSDFLRNISQSLGSGQGPVAGCCECGDEPSASGATELVS
jgi:hypothetical protein